MQTPPLPRETEAKLRYRHGAFDIVFPGSYVTCAVTGRRIPLDRLRYWSVDRQEAYADAAAALQGLVGDPLRRT
ncbi:MAG TPA: DUF2093 domain-containing protein [Ferrovibrio sp.]|jgi:hypothetical protein|uniref:DUF2093 domain-containing protein n=1 Tax=Ferrovibrio sp. TaxID=1917215 RepID=UPI002ED6BE02